MDTIVVPVIRARWTLDISLDSSVVEHLTSDAGVLGSIPGPAIYIHLYFLVYVHSSNLYQTIYVTDKIEVQNTVNLMMLTTGVNKPLLASFQADT